MTDNPAQHTKQKKYFSHTPRNQRHQHTGKRVGGSVYYHRSAVKLLESSWRDLVARAEECAGYPAWNVVRLGRDSDDLSLLHYPHFDEEPIPALAASVRVRISAGRHERREYASDGNPPVLHRKELLLPPDHPERPACQEVTEALEEAQLLTPASSIGRQQQWEERLRSRGYTLDGWQLKRTNPDTGEETGTAEPSTVSGEPPTVARHKTAIRRSALSTPMQALARHGYLDGNHSIFDYGCGQGDDLTVLAQNGISAQGWDPHYRPDAEMRPASVVNLGFVINVIEEPSERTKALKNAFAYAEELLVVAAMLGSAEPQSAQPWRDGVLTRRGTFQKYFSQEELRHYLQTALDRTAIPVGPGVFFVFRDPDDAELFMERRSIRRTPHRLLLERAPMPERAEAAQRFFETHQETLDALWHRYLQLGRRPDPDEVPNLTAVEAACGSLKRGYRFLERFHGAEAIQNAAAVRHDELCVFLAQEYFTQRRRMADYSASLQRDIRTFFGSLGAARKEAERLLYASADPVELRSACYGAAQNGVGVIEEERAFFFQAERLSELPAVVQTYVACASHLYGDVAAYDLIKVHLESGKLTLLRYDDFHGKPLPLLMERIKISLRKQTVQVFTYGEDYTPPYLYMKSRFLSEEDPGFEQQRDFDMMLAELSTLDFEGLGPTREVFEEELQRRWVQIGDFTLEPIPESPPLEHRCGEHLTFGDLCSAGETVNELGVTNAPKEPATYAALAALIRDVLDPVMDYFGGIELTYGFAGPEVSRAVPANNAPELDQHASYERNRRGNRICARGGAAVDFLVPDESMAEVAVWIAENLPFDRMYFYGDCRPLHVSLSPECAREIVRMETNTSGRRVPKRISRVRSLLE
ncbi:DNA phosphorothioation-associated putative methyltransferase [Halorhodospira sp. 9621]|uniref:DNA phosphorothioation-associated putative methyltransferase n=1 Tax=Halorhodospira sp. 9621 TaxID=2899135 RepID=UPI001EE7B9D5|nr:DNA phosphorothioation-associated putative methyltransferase [Halorhodospira sp. 9621]MCG5534250.1 DNA phosphorothioation-associated putative methyltransferase [Halorhodospira sp. 9621]